MLSFPISAALEFYRNQAGMASKVVGNLLQASTQLGNLQLAATRKLMEESTAAMQKALTLRTPQDTQAFFMEQSQLAVERVRGYQQHMRSIAGLALQGTIPGAMPVSNVQSTNESRPMDAAGAAPDQHASSSVKTPAEAEDKHAASSHPHEVDPHPSALVEKLISVAVHDTGSSPVK